MRTVQTDNQTHFNLSVSFPQLQEACLDPGSSSIWLLFSPSLTEYLSYRCWSSLCLGVESQMLTHLCAVLQGSGCKCWPFPLLSPQTMKFGVCCSNPDATSWAMFCHTHFLGFQESLALWNNRRRQEDGECCTFSGLSSPTPSLELCLWVVVLSSVDRFRQYVLSLS